MMLMVAEHLPKNGSMKPMEQAYNWGRRGVNQAFGILYTCTCQPHKNFGNFVVGLKMWSDQPE